MVVRALAIKTGDHHGAKIFRLKPKDTGKPLGGFNRGWRRGYCFRFAPRKITAAAAQSRMSEGHGGREIWVRGW